MDNKEAIDELLSIRDDMPHMECGDWIDAIDVAIQAIKELECWQNLGLPFEQVREAVYFYNTYGEAYADVMKEMIH